ncbi:hypothetical protein [uncultured Pontibacter sp.]|uniref:hypothetical protein n=1 Tax=uncultured Pontibacter sp. TaxID=453356 RepID=UPI00261882F5|nr:hypothetical protein [uncultured Pontibacter sp.]
MIYTNKLNASFVNASTFNMAGCRRIFFMPSKNLVGYTFRNRQVQTINTVSGDRRFSAFEELESLAYNVKPESGKNGTVYNVEVSFGISGIKADTKHLLDSMVNSELAAIVEDENYRYWLLGFGQGLITTYEAISDEGGYSVKMGTKQLAGVEEVSYEFMSTIQLNMSETTSTPSPINLQPVSSGSGGSQIGNVYNTINVTTDFYQVQNTDHYLKITSAKTVLLPESPYEGQQHIFIAAYNASVAPVVIKSAIYFIDGSTQAEINSDYGSLTFVFQGGTWSTTAFVA